MRRTFTLAAGLLALAAGAGRAQTTYEVTPAAGAYLICVQSFMGPPSKALTEEFIQELRTKYRLPAYSFCRSAEEKRKEQERIEQVKAARTKWLREAGLPEDTRLRPIKTYKIEDQYAVFVGGYKDQDAAVKALADIRKLPPPSPKFMNQAGQGLDGQEGEQVVHINPFRAAFVVPNPATQAARAAAKDDGKPDPRLKEYNAGERYSLLKNPKPWTLVVKTYQGASTIQQTMATKPVVRQGLSGAKAGELLNANSRQAHELAKMIRDLPCKYDAYVLHTEYSSVVTIGGFDGPDDPRLIQTQRAIVSELQNPNSNLGQLHLKAQVNFFAQPIPMAVPKF